MPTKHTIEEIFDLNEPYASSPEVIAYGKELDRELGELDASFPLDNLARALRSLFEPIIDEIEKAFDKAVGYLDD